MLNWIFAIVDRVPRWALPAVAGAIFLGGIVSLRLVVAVFAEPARVGEGMVIVAVAAAGGAAGGLVYSFIGRPLRRIPRVGPYMTGIVTVAGYMGALAVLMPYVDPQAPNFLGDPVGGFAFAFVVLLFGIFMGRQWFSGPDALGTDLPDPLQDATSRRPRR